MSVFMSFTLAGGIYLCWSWLKVVAADGDILRSVSPDHGSGVILLIGLVLTLYGATWLVVQYGTEFTELEVRRPGWVGTRVIRWEDVAIVRLRISRHGRTIDLVSAKEWFPLDCEVYEDQGQLYEMVGGKCAKASSYGFELW